MQIQRVALGAVGRRGAKGVTPSLVTLPGHAETDFLGRHVQKVRSNDQARALFVSGATVPGLLAILPAATDADFVTAAEQLQDLLADSMAQAPSASECVTALVHARDQTGGPDHITVLKLDANVEAARRDISKGVVTLRVLNELLPTPRNLQKGLSWPDDRQGSDALVVDSNAENAQYFERAYELQVSLKTSAAIQELHEAIVSVVPQADLPQVFAQAAPLGGTVDSILSTLATQNSALAPVVQQRAASPRPSGIVPPNRVAARPVVWSADGVQLRVPPHLANAVTVSQKGTQYVLSIVLDSEPHRGS